MGKKKQGNKKFIYWSKLDGGAYGQDTCTWQPMDEELNADFLVGKRAKFKLGQTLFYGTITKVEGVSKYFVEFDSRRHKDRVVDLELKGPVSSGEYSWWRLEGYDTFNDDNESEEPMLRHED